MKREKNKSIAVRLVTTNSTVLALAFLFMLVVVALINFEISVTKERQVMHAYLLNALSSVDNHLKDMARVSLMSYSDEETQRILQHNDASSYFEQQDSQDYLSRLYSSLIILRQDISGIYLFDKDRLVFRQDGNNSSLKRDADIPAFIRWMEQVEAQPQGAVAGCQLRVAPQPAFMWLPPTKNPFENYCIYMMREVRSFSPNERIGHILLTSPVQNVKKTLEESCEPDADFLLLLGDGTVLCSQSGDALGRPVAQIEPELWHLLQNGGEQATVRGRYAGQQSMISYASSAYSGLTLVTVKPLRLVYRSTLQFLLFASLACVLLAVVLLLFTRYLTRSITRPIQVLSNAMGSFAKNNTRPKLPVENGGDDEVAMLTKTFNLMLDTINDLIIDEYENTLKMNSLQLQKKEIQLLYLRSQINPHFLYNTLDTIRMKAAMNGDCEVADMILLLVDFFRYGVGNNCQTVTLAEEVRFSEIYLQLMKYRYKELETAVAIEPGLENISIPNFILQPLVENSLLHGLKSVCYRGKVSIAAYRDAQRPQDLLLQISDNGVGMEPERLSALEAALTSRQEFLEAYGSHKREHIGLFNVQLRIRMFYSEHSGIHFRANPEGGITAQIRLQNAITQAFPQERGYTT